MTTTPEELERGAAFDVGAEKVAKVYAEALLTEALKHNQGPETLEDLETLVGQVFPANPQLEEFLGGSAVGREKKAEIIKSAFENRCPQLLVNFLLVLNDHERLGLLRTIVPLYRQLLDERVGRIRVRVRSAVPLTDEQLGHIRDQVRQSYQREAVLETETDPSLLGGLVVRVGDWLYDASVRTRLENLRDQIIENSSHEIQTGRDRFSLD